MPPLPWEIKHHPSSVSNIIVHQLIESSNHKTLSKFLSNELFSATPSLAKWIILHTIFRFRQLPLVAKPQPWLKKREQPREAKPPIALWFLQISLSLLDLQPTNLFWLCYSKQHVVGLGKFIERFDASPLILHCSNFCLWYCPLKMFPLRCVHKSMQFITLPVAYRD
jgi:hypothetical protein